MSKNKQSNYDITEVELPIKRVTGETVEDVLTSNAYNNILPARYLKKNEEGEVVEDPSELFERVAKNVALADTVYKAEDNNINIKATPQDIKPEASSNRRQDLCEEIFGEDVSLDDNITVDVTEDNVYAFAYDTIVPKLPNDIADQVHETAEKFEEDMTNLSFMPNSPTLMNAGDDFQQLSACFVDSPDDDINNIHETAKEAAKIFQCLTEDTIVETDEGRKKIIDISKGDKILQRGDSDTQFATVQDVFVYDDAPTVTITLKSGQEITGTPNHDLLVNGDWKSIGEIQNDDNLHIPINYDIPESNEPELKSVESGSQWESDVNVEEIIRLNSEGYNDHEIAERIESSSSTVQRWRSNRLNLAPNDKSGAKKGQNVEFDEKRAKELYSQGLSDPEIAKELDISKSAIRSFRIRNSLDRNNVAIKDVQQPDNFTSSLAELVGIWIGDGSFHKDGVRFHIRRDSVKEHIEDICTELFDVKPNSNWSGGCYEMCIHSHEIKRWWKENFGNYKPSSSESSVPDIVFKSGENEISSFIRGLFTADGSLTRKKYPTLTTVSNDLASDIQSLLVRIGIPAKDHTDISDNSIDSEYERHYVSVTTETGLSRYPEVVGWIDDERSLENSISIEESTFKSGQHGYVDKSSSEWIVPIESVDEEENQSVYDISVEGKSEYIANDIVSHNSGGGMGYAFTNLRPYGDRVGSTGGIASGPISFMRTFDQMCFPSGTEVLTDDGRDSIENIDEGDIVVDENGEYQEVCETMQRNIEENIVEIETSRINKKIKSTREHPFMRIRDGKREWVEAENLREGDYIRVNARKIENDLDRYDSINLSNYKSGAILESEEQLRMAREMYGASKGTEPNGVNPVIDAESFLRLAGWYLAEGCVTYQRGIPSAVYFTLNNSEKDVVNEIQSALTQLNVDSRIKEVEDRNTLHVIAENSTLAEMFKSWFGEGHKEKTVPRFIREAPVESQVTLLTSLFEGDSHHSKRGSGSQRISLGITSKDVVNFVYEVGIRSGTQFSRYKEENEEKSDVYQVSMSVSTALNTPMSRLFDDVPNEFDARDRSKTINGYEVVEIKEKSEKTYSGNVYNLNVENTHSYIAEDLVVHNCGTIAQGGKRRGAQMGILRIDHPDIIQYIHAKDEDVSLAHELKLNDPDDFTHNSFREALEEARELVTVDDNGVKKVEPHLRNAAEGHLSNFNISVGVTDDFMEAVKNDEEYDMINPRTGEPHIATAETKELYGWFDLGDEVEVGEPLSVPAREIYERITKGAWENGEPGMIFLERANKMHSFDVDEHPEHEILATNPCVTGDTLVATADGRGAVPIEELTDEEDVQVYTRTDDGVGVALANNIRKTREDADLVEVTTDGEVSLECTEDHPIWTRNRGWVEAGNLKEGDSLHILYETDHNSGYNNVTWTDDKDQWNLEHRLVARDLLDMDISGYTIHHKDENKTNNNSENLSVIDPSEHGAKHSRDISGDKNPIHKLKQKGEFEEYKEDNLFYDTEGENNPMYGKSHSEETKEKIADSDYEERSKKVSETIQKQYNEGKPVECKECGEEFKSLNLHLNSHDMTVQDYREKYGDDVRLSAAQPVENHKVVSVEQSGSEDVYDLEVPETHNFYAGDTDGEYINIHNCGEQPLEEYEACNLGHINLSTLVDKEAPDWREFESEEDNLEKQVGDFLSNAIDWSLLDRRIHNGTHFLENVVTMSDFPVDEITEKVGSNRKIGLGIMGLAQMYVQLGTRYGSEVSNEIARQLMSYINHESKRESHKIATGKSEYAERGSFENWHKSKYSDPTEYSEWFEKLTGQNPEEWEDGYKIRNHNTTTIAPTGTTSMIGDTTGGCEPIYDVAYYKNVSGDVQGDEMLVEFDDYFLRTLEANNIDIDPVKEEAEEMMSKNNFEGVDSLETVPDAIGELFITTSDLSALEHARVQCALQDGVDSAISKTVNAPEDATPEDAQDAFMEVYDKGGKGVTYYRDGTRSKQVLTTREDNQGEDEDQEPVDVVKQKLESGELDASDLGLEQDKSEEETDVATDNTVEPKSRPKSLVGVTKELDTRYGDLFVTINETENGKPFEVFANIGKSGGYTESFTESTARLISLCLRCGIEPETIIDQIEGIRSPRVSWDEGDQIYSVPDGIALALRRYNNEDHNVETVETDEDQTESKNNESDSSGRSVIDSGENPECPKCSSLSLYYSEGCKTCESCGWSEC